MKTTSVNDLHRDLAAMIDSVVEDHDPVIIVREAGQAPAVLMSLEDFSAYEETHHLLRSPANAARLRDSIRQLERGEGLEKTLLE